MSEKIRIGENEYQPPFEVWYANGSFNISWDDGEGGRNYPDPGTFEWIRIGESMTMDSNKIVRVR